MLEADYEKECMPPLEEWEQYILENKSLLKTVFATHSTYLVARQELREQALIYDRYLADRAGDLKIPYPKFAGKGETIVASGHQPVTVHAGLFEKYRLLENYSEANGATGINFVLDTDAGGVDLVFSAAGSDVTSLRRVSLPLTRSHGWYGGQRLQIDDEFHDQWKSAVSELKETGQTAAATALAAAGSVYSRLDGWTLADASTLVRRVFQGLLQGGTLHYLDVPLSKAMELDAAVHFAADFILNADKVFTMYNRVLQEFRKRKRIKNAANPFPDLTRRSEEIELPFWIYEKETGTRMHLFVELEGERIKLKGSDANSSSVLILTSRSELFEELLRQRSSVLIIPRAAFLSLMFRLLFSDLFIHGRGGAKYDECTNDMISAWYGIDPPAFAAVSADRFLFQNEKTNLHEMSELKTSLRDIIFHPEQYQESGFLTAEEAESIGEIKKEKEDLVNELKERKQRKEPAADLTATIKIKDAAVKEIVDLAFKRLAGPYADIPGPAEKVIHERTFPFYLFSPEEYSKQLLQTSGDSSCDNIL